MYRTANRRGTGGFRKGRGCVDQVFALKNVCEKYLEKNRCVYMAFMDLEKAYDRVEREALWKVLNMYGVERKLVRAVKIFYEDSMACVRVGRVESDWFGVKVGLRQGCVMSPWLFNLYADGVVREVKARVQGKGVTLVSANEEVYEVCQLLFADDTVLVADSREKLQSLVNAFGVVCERRKLNVNVSKSKVMWCNREGRQGLHISLNGKRLEEVNCFRYLGVDVKSDGRSEVEVAHRMEKGMQVFGALGSVWKGKGVSVEAKVGMYESIVVPTVLYGCETWCLNARERKKVDVMEMKCLRSICGVRLVDRVRNERVRERCGIKVRLLERANRGVLRWFGHVERMSGERLVKKVYKSKVEGVRGIGCPRRKWLDGVKDVLFEWGLDIQEAEWAAQDRVSWRDVVKGRQTV